MDRMTREQRALLKRYMDFWEGKTQELVLPDNVADLIVGLKRLGVMVAGGLLAETVASTPAPFLSYTPYTGPHFPCAPSKEIEWDDATNTRWLRHVRVFREIGALNGAVRRIYLRSPDGVWMRAERVNLTSVRDVAWGAKTLPILVYAVEAAREPFAAWRAAVLSGDDNAKLDPWGPFFGARLVGVRPYLAPDLISWLWPVEPY
jgi:hypothetical protein